MTQQANSEAFPDDAAIEQVALAMLDRSLPKEAWTHAAHFATSLWLWRHRPDFAATGGIGPAIRAYNEAVGGVNSDEAGYHETITVASMAAARRFMAGFGEDVPLHEILAALVASPLGRTDWLLAYWSRDRLFSVAARRGWVEPDLMALPT